MILNKQCISDIPDNCEVDELALGNNIYVYTYASGYCRYLIDKHDIDIAKSGRKPFLTWNRDRTKNKNSTNI